jgi:5-methylcytosine-specific restriction endonuclease McrA
MRGGIFKMTTKKYNPRYANGNLRRKHRARFKSMNAPCGICRGQLGPIHYDEPSNAEHPLSFVIDEIHPVSKWEQFGYNSAREAAEDWNNLQAAHYFCNQKKSDKLNFKLGKVPALKIRGYDQTESDGSW